MVTNATTLLRTRFVVHKNKCVLSTMIIIIKCRIYQINMECCKRYSNDEMLGSHITTNKMITNMEILSTF